MVPERRKPSAQDQGDAVLRAPGKRTRIDRGEHEGQQSGVTCKSLAGRDRVRGQNPEPHGKEEKTMNRRTPPGRERTAAAGDSERTRQ